MNPSDSDIDLSNGQDDQDELAHDPQDSPGMAAKKARLRAKMSGGLQKSFKTGKVGGSVPTLPPVVNPMANDGGPVTPPMQTGAPADMTRVQPNGQTGGSLATNALGTAEILKKFIGLLAPGSAGAQEASAPAHMAVGAQTDLPPMISNAPAPPPMNLDKNEQGMRAMMRKADPATLKRFQAKVSQPRKEY